MFVSSSGMSLDIHFCQGKVKRANFFGKAKTCEEVQSCLMQCGQEPLSCHAKAEGECVEGHKGCCNNKSFQLDFDFEAIDIFSEKLSELQEPFFTAFTYSYVLNLVPSRDATSITKYLPPPLEKDIAVLFQVFRL